MELEQGDVVLCTVERVERTIVFVKVLFEGKELEGSITTSEIAAGRIRNIRDYVVPKKKIICKVLRISHNGNIELSLRRVTPKETKELLNKYKEEKSHLSLLKSILGEKTDRIVKEITKTDSVYDFLNEAKSNSSKLEKIAGKENAKKIVDALKSQKKRKTEIKKEIKLKSSSPDGLMLLKKLFENVKGIEIRYVSAGRYSLKTESDDLKKADNKLREIISEIEKNARKQKIEFSILEK
ncbi:MAG: hypothetical protein ABIH49_01375 [archaeon]